jgi:hypothetical protein
VADFANQLQAFYASTLITTLLSAPEHGGCAMAAESKTHEALVADWQAHAESRDDKNYRFLRSLKNKSGKQVDRSP